ELGRALQALEMVGEAKDGRAALGLVGANPLEDTGAVVEPVGPDVDRRIRPVDQLAVHPDLLRLAHVRAVPFRSVAGLQIVPGRLNGALSQVSGTGLCN